MESTKIDMDKFNLKSGLTVHKVLQIISKVTGKPLEELIEMEKTIRALTAVCIKINYIDKFAEMMTDHAGLWLLYGALLGKHFPQEILENE